MLDKLALVALISMLPVFELRLGIPLGILREKINLGFGLEWQGLGLPWPIVFATAVIANILAGLIVFAALHKLLGVFLAVGFIKNFYNKIVRSTQKKAKPYVDKYGTIGLALFIAIPLPGTGAWAGALAAFLFGFPARKFFVANALGVFAAGAIVTALTLGVFGVLNI